jgi:hypothetical protein
MFLQKSTENGVAFIKSAVFVWIRAVVGFHAAFCSRQRQRASQLRARLALKDGETDPNDLRPPRRLHVLYDLSLDAFYRAEERLQLFGRLELSLVLLALGVERPELHARRREVVVDDELGAGWKESQSQRGIGRRGCRGRTPGEGMAAPIQVTAVRMGLVGKAALRAAARNEERRQ